MAAAIPQSDVKVLEDGDEALLPEVVAEEGEEEEIVDLSKPAEEPAPAAKPAAKPAAAKKPAAAPAEDEEEIPADLKGKTPAQLAKMVRDAQQLIGRQGSELGEWRKKVDTLLQASLADLAARRAQQPQPPAAKPAAPAAPAVEDDSEFFAKPREAVLKAIENSPIIQEIKKTLGAAAEQQAVSRATAATERFNAAHPDASQIMADPEFREWVQASKVRTALLQRAHHNFDFDAGDEVFGTWKALKGVGKPAAPAAGEGEPAGDAAAAAAARTLAKRKAALKAAAAPTGGGGTAAAGGTKKIYRRADVLKLMETDQERYEQLAPEIELAYREGRVR